MQGMLTEKQKDCNCKQWACIAQMFVLKAIKLVGNNHNKHSGTIVLHWDMGIAETQK